MGLFYYMRSVALVEDLALEEHYHTPEEFYSEADRLYQQVLLVMFWSCDPMNNLWYLF